MSQANLPILLAVDASANICSIALQVDGIIDHETIIDSKHQAAELIPALGRLLGRNNRVLADIDGYVLSNGPGRFTGLRIATGFLQGLAYSNHKKIITINSLQLLAQQFVAEHQNNVKEQIWVCTKAYNNVYYTGLFALEQSTGMIKHSGVAVTIKNLDDLILAIKNYNTDTISFVGSGWLDVLQNDSDIYTIPAHAKFIFRLANQQFDKADLKEPDQALPEYHVNPYK